MTVATANPRSTRRHDRNTARGADLQVLGRVRHQYQTRLAAAERTLRALDIPDHRLSREYRRLAEATRAARRAERAQHAQQLLAELQELLTLAARADPHHDTTPDDDILTAATAWLGDTLQDHPREHLIAQALHADVRSACPYGWRTGRHLTIPDAADKRTIATLWRAMRRFDDPEARVDENLPDTLHYHLALMPDTAGVPYRAGLKRSQRLTVYRNGNIRITFATDEDAAAFMHDYGMKHACY